MGGLPTESVEIFAWVTDPARKLTRGILQGSEYETHGASIVSDPSKDDSARVKINIIAPDLKIARELLLEILSGATIPNFPWII